MLEWELFFVNQMCIIFVFGHRISRMLGCYMFKNVIEQHLVHHYTTTCWCLWVLLPPTALKCILFLHRGSMLLHICKPNIYICNATLVIYSGLEHWRGKRRECSDAATLNVICFLSCLMSCSFPCISIYQSDTLL